MDPFPLPQINSNPNKISFQVCRTRRRSLKKIAQYGNWTPEEDQLLINLVDSSTEKKHWQGMAAKFQNKTPQQIMNRWNKVVNPSLVKGSWTQEEDENLIEWVRKHGEKEWTKIASQLPGRIGKQCRERWINCLKPNIKRSQWTEEEDNKIIELQSKFGNKWAKIAEFIEGRTDNQIKNRWNSVLKRKIMEPQEDITNSQAEKNSNTKIDNNGNSQIETNVNDGTESNKYFQPIENDDLQINKISFRLIDNGKDSQLNNNTQSKQSDVHDAQNANRLTAKNNLQVEMTICTQDGKNTTP